MSTELWRDGNLRRTTLGTNGFPDEHAPTLPDEMFLDEDNVEILRETRTYGGDAWTVNRVGEDGDRQTFDDFEDAFKYALLIVRQEVEDV